MELLPLGDRAWLTRFSEEAEASSWARAVRQHNLRGILDVVAAYKTVAVHADPDQIDLEQLAEQLRAVNASTVKTAPGRLVELPVYYNGEDLPEVARQRGLSPAEVVAMHASQDYQVLAIGFLPGFPYAGPLPERLRGLARRASPRRLVPAGSVAIAGRQTGIYPADSPGGWHLLGTTPLRIARPEQGHFPIRVGDRLRFLPIDPRQFAEHLGQPLDAGDPEPPDLVEHP
jgi:KipI family sensor histidine kinase inhibitor